VTLEKNIKEIPQKTRVRQRTDRVCFRHVLQHPARKRTDALSMHMATARMISLP